MFKNMSFGKMMALFVGFLVLMVVVAVVIMKMTMQSEGTPGQRVTTKTYAPRNTSPNPEATASTQARPSHEQPVFAAPQGGAIDPSAPADLRTGQVATPVAPVVNPTGIVNQAGSPMQAPNQQYLTDVPPDLRGRFSNIYTVLAAQDARIRALEESLKAASEDKRTESASVQRTSEAKKVARRDAGKQVSRKVVAQKEKSLNELPGYKSMAVVNNRAWVSAPDGTEDSVVEGELVPRVRVRAMNPETGVVITTTNQRIDPRAR